MRRLLTILHLPHAGLEVVQSQVLHLLPDAVEIHLVSGLKLVLLLKDGEV